MNDYRKPSKEKANESYLRRIGIVKKDATPYPAETIEPKTLFLIICEGENTERYYFESFPVPTNRVIVEGGCNSKTALVNYAIKKKKEYPDREIWCVYDYDVKPDEHDSQLQDFNNSIAKAIANRLQIAWSNDAFELWFLLHYNTVDTGITRKEINDCLKKEWKLESFHNEAKTIDFCLRHYNRHGGTESELQKLAIKRAKNLHQQYQGRTDYANHCPCTTVYLLVEALNKNLKA